MIDRPALLDLAQSLARHAASRQSVTAVNLANADTPGYRARRLPAFAATGDGGGEALALRRSRPEHLSAGTAGAIAQARIDTGAPAAPNGNSVSIESEMRRSAAAAGDHRLALAVYESALGLMRTSIGRSR